MLLPNISQIDYSVCFICIISTCAYEAHVQGGLKEYALEQINVVEMI